jgi:hypothetical protein
LATGQPESQLTTHDRRQSCRLPQLWSLLDCIDCALKKIKVNKIPNDRREGVIRAVIKDLEMRKDKAMKRSDTDDFWIKIENLQWVLFVIFA